MQHSASLLVLLTVATMAWRDIIAMCVLCSATSMKDALQTESQAPSHLVEVSDTCTIERILMGSITTWVVRSKEHTIRSLRFTPGGAGWRIIQVQSPQQQTRVSALPQIPFKTFQQSFFSLLLYFSLVNEVRSNLINSSFGELERTFSNSDDTSHLDQPT